MALKSAGDAAATLPQKKGLWAWINKRLPVSEFIEEQLTGYFAPKNFNIWYFFGSLALVVLVLQLVTGIFLTMFYKVGETTSFDSVEYIMREVNFGWLLRYLHSTGASAFFIVVYLHMFRAFLYGSYRKPRELLWLFGMAVYLALMAEAFMGYVLPWGNMSFWGAQVIVNLFGTIPGIGPVLVQWIRGDYGIADATLNRFFALHVVAIPLGLLLLVALHLVALRRTGSNNPDGIEIKEKVGPDGKPLDGIPFHPYYTVKDVFGIGVFFILFAIIVFFVPTLGGLFVDARAHRPGVVLHALLRDPARGARSAPRGAAHAARGGLVPLHALARPLAGEVDPLQGLDLAPGADPVRDLLRGARLPRAAARGRPVRGAGAHLRGHLLRVLLAHALLFETRSGEAGA
jgi:quinol-cytochrome oxidoreductase complex cytochrome b subunit